MRIVPRNDMPRMEKNPFRHGALSQPLVHYFAEGICLDYNISTCLTLFIDLLRNSTVNKNDLYTIQYKIFISQERPLVRHGRIIVWCR